jgi:FO synthase
VKIATLKPSRLYLKPSHHTGKNNAEEGWSAIISAGANDFGGISPVTKDYVNPEKPWPHLQSLAAATAAAGKALVPR